MSGLAHVSKSWRLAGAGLVLAASALAAQPPASDRWLPPDAIVMLLAGLPGDVESETSYRDQLQEWLELCASVRPPPARVLALWERPDDLPSIPGLKVEGFKNGREEFLAAGQSLTGATNPLVVVAWGHGGMQGRTPVFHVRGPRLTAADFKAFADGTPRAESRWLLFFRGSGSFARELQGQRQGQRRQIISSDHDTPFTSDPVAGPLALKAARALPDAPMAALADELGQRVGAWYEQRSLARTEEPTFWGADREPRRLATAESAGALAAKANPGRREAAEPARAGTSPRESLALPAVWKEVSRVDPQRFPEADAAVLRRRVAFTIGSSPAVASEQEEFIQIFTEEGKEHGDFDVSFSPPQEELEFLDCEVWRADGQWLRLDPDEIRDASEPSLEDYGTKRRKFFSLPGVGPGAVLRVRQRTAWKSYPLPHVSLSIPVADEIPVIESTVQVSVPKEGAFHFAFAHTATVDPEVRQSTHGNSYTWRFKEVPAQPAEALTPPGHHPALVISTFPDWAAFAGWYARISQRTDEATPELKAKAIDLTRGTPTDREKVRALYDYVAAMRYVAVPLGVNSFRPHAADKVFKNQFGDCKDKANLFNTMLRSVGLDAHLVLVPRFGRAFETVPGLAFNHAISRVKLGGETLWIDTTDDVCRFGMLPPGDPGRNALVIEEGAAGLVELPRPRPEDHRLTLRARVVCRPQTEPCPVSFEVTATGIADYDLRTVARARRDSGQNLPLLGARFRMAAGAFALEKQSASPASKLDADFTWKGEGACMGLVGGSGSNHQCRAPFWLPKEWDAALHRRQSPIFLNRGYPLALDQEIEFTVADKAPVVLPAPVNVTTGPLRWRLEWTRRSEAVRATLRAELLDGELPASETAGFQTALRELLTALNREATFPASP